MDMLQLWGRLLHERDKRDRRCSVKVGTVSKWSQAKRVDILIRKPVFRSLITLRPLCLICILIGRVEEIIRPVVWSLKEAGEVVLCAGETFGIVLVPQEQNICSKNDTRDTEIPRNYILLSRENQILY